MALKYAVNDVDILDNCDAWWSLNEYSDGSGAVTRYDQTTNNLNLTDNNTNTSTSGNWNRAAVQLAANNEYFERADSSVWDLTTTNDKSVSMWFKSTADITNGGLIVRWNNNSSGGKNLLIRLTSSGYVQVYAGSGGTTGVSVTGSVDVADTNWHHIVVTWSGTTDDKFRIYVDGTLDATSAAASPGASSSTLIIGGKTSESGLPNSGHFQDVAWFSEALSTDQISRLYNSGDGMTYGVDFDAPSTSYSNSHNTNGGSYTWSHTCTGTDRHLLVGIQTSNAGAITGVTYSGTAMTEVDSYTSSLRAPFSDARLFALAAPASGSNTVSVQFNAVGNIYIYTAAGSYVGVDQTTPNPHKNKAQGTSNTSLSVSVDTSGSPSTDNCWVAGVLHTDGNYTQGVGTGTIKRTAGVITQWIAIIDQNQAITPAGSDSIDGTLSSASNMALIGTSLSPAQAAAPAASFTPKAMWFM